jgi:serine/threonine-protein kinase
MASEYSNLPSGASLQGGKYTIIKVLGQGGFGITYLAEQTGLGMKVAIKEFFLKGSCQRDSSTSRVSVPVTDNKELVVKCLKKFKSEARKIASLNNDHIVSIIDIFDENGTSYYVMKYLDGGSLADRIRHSSLSEENALSIIREVADALKTIHANNLLHLDIKPANILFDDYGRAVLIDFGVSKYVDDQKDTMTTSSLVGFSRGFAPLEQVNATVTALSPATDIYSLGATLYNLVVGITPPDAAYVMDTGLPVFPAEISLGVRNVIEKAMQPRRKDRPQDINAFLETLPHEEFSDEEDVTVVSVRPGAATNDTTLPGHPKNKILFWFSMALFVSSFVFAGIAIYQKTLISPPMPDNSRMETLVNTVDSLTTKNKSLQKQVNEMKNQISNSSQTNNSMQRQIDDLKKKNSEQSSQITSLQRDNSNLKNQVTEYKQYERDAMKWRRQNDVNSRR